ncbi:MAG: triphosphoribosyl-dephospho-CoA synthase [Actinomycetota bacterium]|nr:triphosphoribosyl-dephospho-CoA synthase [Actinomycetota bacterium]
MTEPYKAPRPAPKSLVAASVATAMVLVYGAPTPGVGSRYADSPLSGAAPYESRVLSTLAARDALAASGDGVGVGETVLEAARSSLDASGHAEVRSAAYLAPLAKAALLGVPTRNVLSRLGRDEIPLFVRAFEAAGIGGPLVEVLGAAVAAGDDSTLRDAMGFASRRDPLARDYARNYEVPRDLARPAILSSLSRAESARASLVHAYLEVLAEIPDLDITARAGQRESEDVSRMAKGVLKAGGAHSRRGLEGLANLDGILREDPRLSPTATEPMVIASAFMVCMEYGPDALNRRLRPAFRA